MAREREVESVKIRQEKINTINNLYTSQAATNKNTCIARLKLMQGLFWDSMYLMVEAGKAPPPLNILRGERKGGRLILSTSTHTLGGMLQTSQTATN